MSEYKVWVTMHVSDGYPILVNDPDERIRLAEQGEELESFQVDIPDSTVDTIVDQETDVNNSQTIYYQSAVSDGYIDTLFYIDRNLAQFHYDLDFEGFGATDSQGYFECTNPVDMNITTLKDVMESVYRHHEAVDSLNYLRNNHPEELAYWHGRWVQEGILNSEI